MESKILCLDKFVLRVNTLIRLRTGKKSAGKETILFITKFPPIVGGVATLEYWRAYMLAELGNTVIVVTNCIEDCNGYAFVDQSNTFPSQLKFPKNEGMLMTFFTSRSCTKNKQIKRNHQHIPYNDMSTTKLYSLAEAVIKKYKPNVIYSGYLEPYGMVSYLLSEKYDIPYILGFAGSDFSRLLCVPELNRIYSRVLRKATLIMTSWNKAERLIGFGVEPEYISCIPQPIVLPEQYYDVHCINRGYTVGIYGKCGKHKKIDMILSGIGAVKKIQINCMTIPANREYLKESIQRECPQNKVLYFEAKYPYEMSDFLNLNQIMFFCDESFDVADHVPIAPIEAGLSGVCVVLSKNLYKSMVDFGFIDNFNCIVMNECSAHQVENILNDFVQNADKYIEIGRNSSKTLRKEINKNLDEYEDILNNARWQKREKNLRMNRLIGLYVFFKYTMLLVGEDIIVSTYNLFQRNKENMECHLIDLLNDFTTQIKLLCKDKVELTYLEKEIIEMELLKIRLYKMQLDINRTYWDTCIFERNLMQTYVKCFSVLKIDVDSNAFEILRGRRVIEINQMEMKNIFILCKNNYEIVIYDGNDEYAHFLYNKFIDVDQGIINFSFWERAIDEGLIWEY